MSALRTQLVRTGYVTAAVRAPGCDLTGLHSEVDPMLPGGWQVESAATPVDPDVWIDVRATIGVPWVDAAPDGQVRVALGSAALTGATLAYVLYTVSERARQHRGMVTVHAAAALDPTGRAVLLLGDKGAGKTSMLLALLEHGYRFLGDDLVVLTAPVVFPDAVGVLPGRRRSTVRQPGARLGYETKQPVDHLPPELGATPAGGWPLGAVARVSVHPATAAAMTDPAPLSLTERLRLAENLGRYIAGTPTPLALEPEVHAPVYALDDPAAATIRSRLIGRIGALGLRYLHAPTAVAAAAILADLTSQPKSA